MPILSLQDLRVNSDYHLGLIKIYSLLSSESPLYRNINERDFIQIFRYSCVRERSRPSSTSSKKNILCLIILADQLERCSAGISSGAVFLERRYGFGLSFALPRTGRISFCLPRLANGSNSRKSHYRDIPIAVLTFFSSLISNCSTRSSNVRHRHTASFLWFLFCGWHVDFFLSITLRVQCTFACTEPGMPRSFNSIETERSYQPGH